MQTTTQAMKLIAIYARVSTARQEEEQTIRNQLNTLKEYARNHGYTIVHEYVDDGWSGDILQRPALDQLRQDASGKIWDSVLIYDPDRLARRYSYQELVMDELRERDIEVLFVTVDSPKNSEDKILHGVRGLFAEYERTKISERFRLGKLRKLQDGHILTSVPLYGYDYIPKREGKHGYYKINEIEAGVVKMIFEWVGNEGMTLRGVVRKLKEMGIKPRKSKRGVWSTSTLSTLLRHRAYIGEAHWGSSYAVVPEKPLKDQKYRKVKKTSRRIRPEVEWITVPVPAIIDKELFDRTRRQLKKNFALCVRNTKNEYLLAGKVRCPCGRTRSGEGPQNGKYLYYRCTDRVSSWPNPSMCPEKGINARVADKLVWEKVAQLMSSPNLLSQQIERYNQAKHDKTQSSAEDVEILEKEVAKLTAEENRYNKAYGAGVFTVEQLKEYTTPIKERIAKMESQIERGRRATSHAAVNTSLNHADIVAFSGLVVKILKEDLNFSVKREIVMNVVDKIIGTQKELHVHGHIPVNNDIVLGHSIDPQGARLATQKYVKLFTNDRHSQDTNTHSTQPVYGGLIPFSFVITMPVRPSGRGYAKGCLY
ncbi:MAG: recombinase family protein [Nitrososphaera sp.]|nr:recombinase family protein [Nitrososphaera sp.]